VKRRGARGRTVVEAASTLAETWRARLADWNLAAALSVDGGGWRLPTVKELVTLFDVKKTTDPRIDSVAFATPYDPIFLANPTWTSSDFGGAGKYKSQVNFSRQLSLIDGGSNASGMGAGVTRCVR
jgi:hypothetical protein